MATLNRRVEIAAVVMAIAVFALIVASRVWDPGPGSNQPTPSFKVSIGIPSVSANAAWFMGLERGLFAREGVDIAYQPYAVGLHALQAVRDGKADLAIVADTPFMFAVMEGAPIAIAVTTYNSRTALAILARGDRGISQPADLLGRTIGYVYKTNGHFFLDSFLLFNGLGANDVSLRDLSPQQIVPAFTDGTVDAISTWEPLLSSASAAVGSSAVEFHAPELYTFRFNLVGTRHYLDSHRDELRAIIRGLRRANQAVMDDPVAAAAITATMQGTPNAAEIPRGDYQAVLDQALLVALEEQARWAVAKGFFPAHKQPNFLRNIAPEALLAEVPADVSLVR